MPTIRAFCSVCNKYFTESLTESRDNYDVAEKKARGRAGNHMWGKHLADNPTWEEMSTAAWDALVQQLRVEASWWKSPARGSPPSGRSLHRGAWEGPSRAWPWPSRTSSASPGRGSEAP